MKVHLFSQCMVDMFYPQVGSAAIEVLERLGCEVIMPKNQVCCGQPLINTGYTDAAKAAVKQTIATFEEAEVVVSLSGSCAFAIRDEYQKVLADEPQWLRRAEKVAGRLHEWTAFLVDVLGVTDVGARLPGRLAYHQSCHVTRLLGVREAPLTLLSHVRDLQMVPLQNADRCCGFGGTFAVKKSAVSELIVEDKARAVINSGADILCGADQACLMNIAGMLERMRDQGIYDRDIRVMHIAEVLNSR